MKPGEALAIYAEIARMFPQARCELLYTNELELLVAIILSAQTTDEAVNRATPALFSRFRTVEDYAGSEPEEIGEFIRHLGLYQNKARFLRDACRMILDRFDGIIPANQADLESLP
ncbi:MAG TPA: endonuclease III, partial [Bacillota bacterium]|nr:endonuclease III [Bacillota bacterium]